MGKAAASLLVHEGAGDRAALTAFTPEIIVRQSTAPLPRK
jgi:DNA-binding LacI/PurR family transcriptional regulator